MTRTEPGTGMFSGINKYRFRTMLVIAVFWTLIDLMVSVVMRWNEISLKPYSLLLRAVVVFAMSLGMGYLFMFALRKFLRRYPMWLNFLLKALLIVLLALVMNFLVHLLEYMLIDGLTLSDALRSLFQQVFNLLFLLQNTLYWLSLLVITQLYVEINEKFSPGVFKDILIGKYFRPRVEDRIVMFIDLKDSTPIAEKLGHEKYFLFIREFIYQVSMALIEYNGRIYQYVGDEIVVSWRNKPKNIKNCLAAVIQSRKNIQRVSEKFRRKFNEIPEFRVGIHVGEVTVGEIGVIKKDLAMSGDTMNTTARIRSACNELNQKFIVSRQFIEESNLTDWQAESLGMVDLKGKAEEIELFSLKI